MTSEPGTPRVGVLLFDAVEELDPLGPWEVRRHLQYDPRPPA